MKCLKCGSELIEGCNFCPNCGLNVDDININLASDNDEHMKCPKCGEKLIEGCNFCPNCGLNVDDININLASDNGEHMKCPKCGEKLIEGCCFCPNCGEQTDNSDKVFLNLDNEDNSDNQFEENEKFKQPYQKAFFDGNPKKKIGIGIGIILIIAIVIGIVIFSNSGAKTLIGSWSCTRVEKDSYVETTITMIFAEDNTVAVIAEKDGNNENHYDGNSSNYGYNSPEMLEFMYTTRGDMLIFYTDAGKASLEQHYKIERNKLTLFNESLNKEIVFYRNY